MKSIFLIIILFAIIFRTLNSQICPSTRYSNFFMFAGQSPNDPSTTLSGIPRMVFSFSTPTENTVTVTKVGCTMLNSNFRLFDGAGTSMITVPINSSNAVLIGGFYLTSIPDILFGGTTNEFFAGCQTSEGVSTTTTTKYYSYTNQPSAPLSAVQYINSFTAATIHDTPNWDLPTDYNADDPFATNAAFQGFLCVPHTCNTKSSLDATVCSQHGICTGKDMCTCNAGFFNFFYFILNFSFHF